MSEALRIIIPVLLTCFIKAQYDYHEIGKGKWIKHGLEWGIWAVAVVVVDWLIGLKWIVLPLQALLCWLVFDAYLNYLRGLHLFKVGETFWLDRFFQRFKNGELIMLLSKIIMIGLTLTLYIYAK